MTDEEVGMMNDEGERSKEPRPGRSLIILHSGFIT
jgi:hypothetical protein